MDNKIREVVSNFRIEGELVSAEENAQGNINSTYLLTYERPEGSAKYLLQKINSNVFKEPYLVMRNIGLVSKHIKKKLAEMPGCSYKTLSYVPTLNDEPMYTHINEAGEKEYYRVYEYIDDCISYNNFRDVENPEEVAYNAGKCFGAFHMLLSDFPVSMLADTIPDFHNTPKRFEALLIAIENGITNRAFECPEEIVYLISKIKEYSAIYNKLGRTIPVRVTHNDTKLNNILMSASTSKGVAVIDLDTVMPGSVLYDIGDGIRSACANSFEDETNPAKIFLKIDLAKAYIKGYLEEMACSLTYDEVRCIGLSIRVITYELALRFLTDYINGDTYFKIKYKTHNKARFMNQFMLLKDIENKADELDAYVEQLYRDVK